MKFTFKEDQVFNCRWCGAYLFTVKASEFDAHGGTIECGKCHGVSQIMDIFIRFADAKTEQLEGKG